MLTPVHLIFGIRFTSLHKFPEVEDEIGCNRRYGYVNEKLKHCWKRWYRDYPIVVRESVPEVPRNLKGQVEQQGSVKKRNIARLRCLMQLGRREK